LLPAAGQQYLAKVEFNEVIPTSTDINNNTHWTYHCCTSNVAIFINGTEVVREPWKNITTVTPTNNGKGPYDWGSALTCTTWTYNSYGCCVEDGAIFA
jgi:hypothetical protein